jgi:HK97 family phage major capsid protein
MEIREMQMSDIEARKAEIETMLNNEDADLDALNAEVDELNKRASEIKEEAEKRDALLSAIAEHREGIVIAEQKEEKSMSNTVEIRNTKEYIEAYANYIKTGKADECRALLTENVTGGTIPVPEFVYETVKRAWEREGIMTLVNRVSLPGNLKVGFEISATDAEIHIEGTEAPEEEKLTLGVVTLVPQSIKKWITISDEAIDLGGEAFLRYIYEELTHKIAKKAADEVIAKIEASPATSGANAPAVPVLKQDMGLGTVTSAIGLLSDEATDITLVMNKSTWADFRALALQANYPLDIFDERRVVFNNTIKAYSEAAENETYIIVGDLAYGVTVNLPNGDDITIKYDDLSLAESDLVKIVGRMYAGIGVVAPNALVKVTKGA